MAFFQPTSSERRGLIVLCGALLIALVVGVFVFMRHPSDVPVVEQRSTGQREVAIMNLPT